MTVLDADKRQEREIRRERHSRIRRAKQILRPLPRKATLHRYPLIKFFAKTARKQPHLWSFRQREVSLSIYLGSIIAFLPIMGVQFLAGFAIAVLLRINLPIIMGVQLITNLATAVFIYPFTTWVGGQIISLWNLASPDSLIGGVAYASTMGGIFVGLIFGGIVDLLYRCYINRIKSRPINVKRILKN